MIQWQKTQYSERLSLGNVLITASVHWSISGKGYEAVVNHGVIGVFDEIDSAKKAAEENIRLRLKKALIQIERGKT